MSQYGVKRISNRKKATYRRKSAAVIKSRRKKGRKKL